MNEVYLFWVYVFGTILLTVFAIALVILVITQKQKQAKAKLEKQALLFQHERELLNTRLETQEQSMTLISGELHDNVAQLLSLTKMYLNRLPDYLNDPEGAQILEQSQDFLQKALTVTRNISHAMNGDLIQEIGLIKIVSREMDHLNIATGLDCNLEIEGDEQELDREQSLLLFRIIQEVMQNITKHAKATKLDLKLLFLPQSLQVRISDNGKGFDTEKAKSSNSLGLRNIRNRSTLLNASFDISSSPGAGTLFSIAVPLKN